MAFIIKNNCGQYSILDKEPIQNDRGEWIPGIDCKLIESIRFEIVVILAGKIPSMEEYPIEVKIKK
ncbi:MAG: hypothetical protein LIP01_02315 [Tannerellaceae bacterium]|nr:hypothetical protein [Tannerellaceae bacterium]